MINFYEDFKRKNLKGFQKEALANEKLTEKDDFINNVKKYKSNYENLSKNEKCFHKKNKKYFRL